MIRIAAALILLAAPAAARPPVPPVTATVRMCFTPVGPAHCAAELAALIDAENESLHVQAYSFTSAQIVAAITRAHKRGVEVQVILDKSNETGRYSGLTTLRNAGVATWIDWRLPIAHNKVMIFGGRTTVTGSFNFTGQADTRNAENYVVLESVEVARQYEAYFQARKAASRIVP